MSHKANHSLRGTCSSEMFAQQVPEKLVQERTEHHSLEALRICESSIEEQHRAVYVHPIVRKLFILPSHILSAYVHGIPSTPSTEWKSAGFLMPGNVTFDNLNGCTIDITCAIPHPQQNVRFSEEIDELFGHFSA